jgi:hypothetical protein
MSRPAPTSRKRKAFYLLLVGICFFITGLAVLTLGAVLHVNPNITFAGLFKLQPYINLVYSVIP